MPQIGFRGFQTGSAVALSATQFGQTATGSVALWAGGGFAAEVRNGEPVIRYGAGGAISLTVADGLYAGTYATDLSGAPLSTGALEAGPVCLVRPVVSGSTGVGDLLTITPGLWIYAGAFPGDPVFEQRRDGVAISGGVDLSHMIVGVDQGTVFTVLERLGPSAVESFPVAVPEVTLATDASALFRFEPAAVVSDASGAVTLWPDTKSGADGSYDLSEVPTDVVAPVWDSAASKAVFDGAAAIRSMSGLPHPLRRLETEPGAFALFAVLEPGLGVTRGAAVAISESQGANQSLALGFDTSAGGDDLRLFVYCGEWAGAFGTNWSAISTAGVTPAAKMILELHVTQSLAEVRIDGVVQWSAPVVLSNLPTTGSARVTLGARGGASSTDRRAVVDIHEVFATERADKAHVFRAELASRHGIALT